MNLIHKFTVVFRSERRINHCISIKCAISKARGTWSRIPLQTSGSGEIMSHVCFIGKYKDSVEILACCRLAVKVPRTHFFLKKIVVTSV